MRNRPTELALPSHVPIPQPNLAVIAIALFRDPMEREARLPVSAA
jgi:hypothetical protein